MEKTRYQYLQVSDQRRGLPQPPLQVAPGSDATRIALPAPTGIEVAPTDLRAAIEGRVSVRRYQEEPLSLEELSWLLWCTQGVKRVEGSYATMRTVPSAGARHALETYLLVNRVQGLEPGLYRFLALEHELVLLRAGGAAAEEVTAACLGQGMVTASAATFVWVAAVYRMAWRYGQRGYRYLHLDAGHVCQNLYLAAEAIDGGVCAIAAFSDEDMSRVLDLDGENLFAIYVATVGKKG
jgi:SagB-type dehydrogenase family enzyme